MLERALAVRWSDTAREIWGRVVEQERAWCKAVVHPELFGMDHRGVTLLGYLVDRGCLPGPDVVQSGGLTVAVPLESRTVSARFSAPRAPRLVEEVGRYPDTPGVWRALATLSADQHTRQVRPDRGELLVTVELAFGRSSRGEILKDLATLTARYRRELEHPGARRGGGYADLVGTFAMPGLAVPRLPQPLRDRLIRRDDWCWATRRHEALRRIDDYLMETTEEVAGCVEDHAVVTHGGHGLDSWALTWRMAYGPLSFVVQGWWGGMSAGPRQVGELAETFGHVGRLVSIADDRVTAAVEPLPQGKWIRPVMVACSPLRNRMECTLWNPLTGRREPVDVAGSEPWTVIGEALSACRVPGTGG